MTINLNTASRDTLLDEIDRLQGEVDMLKEATGVVKSSLFQEVFKLETIPSRILALLATGRPLTSRQISSAAYYDDPDNFMPVERLRVFIYKIRTACAPHGIEIETVWGVGYRVKRECVEVIQAIIANVAAARAAA